MTQTMTKTQVPEAVATQLQEAVLELIDLALQGKQAHWNITGPNFRPLHLQLDEMVAEYRAWTDLVAERAVALGCPVDGSPATVGERSPLDKFPGGWIKDREVIDLFVDRLGDVIARMRKRVDDFDDKDLMSQDILIEIVQGLEKQRWMLSAQRA